MRLNSIYAVCLTMFWFMVGCASQFHAINANLYQKSGPQELEARLQSLQKIAKERKITRNEALIILGVSSKECGSMNWDRVQKLVYGDNVQIQVPADKLDEVWRDKKRRYAGCSYFYKAVLETTRPRFSWDGVVGKENESHGPSQEVVVIFYDDYFFDAAGFGAGDVNEIKTEWLWSLMGQLLVNGATETGKGVGKKLIEPF